MIPPNIKIIKMTFRGSDKRENKLRGNEIPTSHAM